MKILHRDFNDTSIFAALLNDLVYRICVLVRYLGHNCSFLTDGGKSVGNYLISQYLCFSIHSILHQGLGAIVITLFCITTYNSFASSPGTVS